MKCVFCGNDSSTSRSVEHIVPASFGNSISVLPKGIVCNKCNNYCQIDKQKPKYGVYNSTIIAEKRIDESNNC